MNNYGEKRQIFNKLILYYMRIYKSAYKPIQIHSVLYLLTSRGLILNLYHLYMNLYTSKVFHDSSLNSSSSLKLKYS